MSRLSDKIKNGLDEARILVLGTQVLVGAQLRLVFEQGFPRLSRLSQLLSLSGLTLLLLAFALIVTPASYHRIVERGQDSPRLHRVITTVMAIALFPFAAGLGIDVGVAVSAIASPAASVSAGAATGAVALFFWYGIEALSRDRSKEANLEDGDQADLSQRIVQVLTEARVAIPGAQAMLGFQFAIMLTNKFGELPPVVRWVHVAALLCTSLSIVLFMTPAAYHRLVERGEDTEEFHTVAGRLLLAGLVPLALSMSADLFVVIRAATERHLPALLAAGGVLVTFFGLWFGWTVAVREWRRPRPRRRAHRAQPA